MADEIQYTLSVKYRAGDLKDEVPTETFKLSQTTKEFGSQVVSVGTTEEDLSFTDITTTNPILLVLRNLDASNFVKYGPKNGTNVMEEFGRLRKGEEHLVMLAPSKTLRWVADTAACRVLVKAYGIN